MVIIGDILRKFFARYPFASRKAASLHFGASPSTVKEAVGRELGFRKYAQRCVPRLLDDSQKNHPGTSAIELLKLLWEREAYDFDGITTGNES
jgi:hypothetical protein